MPVFDPLHLNKIGIDQGGDSSRPVVLKLELHNASVFGFSGVKFDLIQGLGRNIDKSKVEIKYTQPLFQLIGPYKAQGKVLVLPVQGSVFLFSNKK